MFVRQHGDNRRTYMLKLGPAHITLILFQHRGMHIQAAIGTGATTRMPGIELTAGISHWNKKEGKPNE
jgi:hypothetical protein